MDAAPELMGNAGSIGADGRTTIMIGGSRLLDVAIIGPPGDREMKPLVNMLVRFKESADLNQSMALVTVDAANDATHQRIVDVLNACGEAGIVGVTLSDDTEEDPGT